MQCYNLGRCALRSTVTLKPDHAGFTDYDVRTALKAIPLLIHRQHLSHTDLAVTKNQAFSPEVHSDICSIVSGKAAGLHGHELQTNIQIS